MDQEIRVKLTMILFEAGLSVGQIAAVLTGMDEAGLTVVEVQA